MTALLHLQSPRWKKQNQKHLSSPYSNFGGSDQWLVTVITRSGRSRGPCVKRNARVCVGQLLMCFLGGWYHWRLAICESMGWLGVQSRARSGWVFSFSPFSSCFRVPASTTDWDLIIGEEERYNYRQFMVATILESWRTFRFYVPLINQNTQINYIIFLLLVSLFSLLFCLLHHIFVGRGILETSLPRSLLLAKATHVLATTLPRCLNILWIVRSNQINLVGFFLMFQNTF